MMDLFSSTVKMLSALCIVLALIVLLYYLLNRFFPGEKGFGGNGKLIKIIATDYLGPKKSVLIVEVAGEFLVLGSTNYTISLLGKIEQKEILDKLNKAEEQKRGSFARMFSGLDRFRIKK